MNRLAVLGHVRRVRHPCPSRHHRLLHTKQLGLTTVASDWLANNVAPDHNNNHSSTRRTSSRWPRPPQTQHQHPRQQSPANGFDAFWRRYVERRLLVLDNNNHEPLQAHHIWEAAELLRVFASGCSVEQIQQGFQLLDGLAETLCKNQRDVNDKPLLEAHHLRQLLEAWQTAWQHNQETRQLPASWDVLAKVERYVHHHVVPRHTSYFIPLIAVWSHHSHPQSVHNALYHRVLELDDDKEDAVLALIQAWHGHPRAAIRAEAYVRDLEGPVPPNMTTAVVQAHVSSLQSLPAAPDNQKKAALVQAAARRRLDRVSELWKELVQNNPSEAEPRLRKVVQHIAAEANAGNHANATIVWERAADAVWAIWEAQQAALLEHEGDGLLQGMDPSTLLEMVTLLASGGKAAEMVQLLEDQPPDTLEHMLKDESVLVSLSWAFAAQGDEMGNNHHLTEALEGLQQRRACPTPSKEQTTFNHRRSFDALLLLWKRQPSHRDNANVISKVIGCVRALERFFPQAPPASVMVGQLLEHCVAASASNRAAPPLAEALVEWMERHTAQWSTAAGHRSVLLAYRNADQLEVCVRYLRKLCDKVQQGRLSKNQVPNSHDLNVIMAALVSSNNGYERARVCLEWMEQAGLEPKVVLYNTLLASLARSNHDNTAKEAEGMLKHMEELYQSGRNRSAQPNAQSYSSTIVAMAASLNPMVMARAEALLQTATKDHIVERTTYKAILSAWRTVGNPHKVEEVFQLLVKDANEGVVLESPKHVDHTLRLRAWAEAGNPDMVCHALEELMEAYEDGRLDAAPTVWNVSAVVEAWAHSQRPEAAAHAEAELRQLFQLAKEPRNNDNTWLDCRPTTHTFNLVIAAYVMEGQLEKALELLEELCDYTFDESLQPNEHSFNAVLAGLANTSGPEALDLMEALLKQMKEEHGIVPNAATFEALIVKHSKRNRAAEVVEEIFQENVRAFQATEHCDESLRPTSTSHSKRLHVWLRARNPEMTMRALLDRMALDTSHTLETADFNAVLKSCTKLPGSGEYAEGVLRQMIRLSSTGLDCAPDVSSFNHVLRAYSHTPNSAPKVLQVLQVLDELKATPGLQPGPETYTGVVAALIRSNAPHYHVERILDELKTQDPSFWEGRKGRSLVFFLEKSLPSLNGPLRGDVEQLKRNVLSSKAHKTTA